jgi:hypothetical protein
MLIVVIRKKALYILLGGVLLIFSLLAGISYSKAGEFFFLKGHSVQQLFKNVLPIKQSTTVYGDPLPWEEVKELLPRFGLAYIVDVETGKRLRVQRRGGTYHADVQPLTARDTKVLKEIYCGKWSWKRRAVIVEIGSNRIAGSIHGMPHGAGNIQNNDFNGHFCLHFLYSRVHASNKIDTAHQMMVWKAAGRPGEPFDKAGPEEVINLVITALNQDDTALASLGLYSAKSEDIWLACRAIIGGIPDFSVKSISEDDMRDDIKKDTNGDSSEGERLNRAVNRRYLLSLSLLYPGETVKRERRTSLTVIKDTVRDRWFVEGSGLKKIIEEG